MSALDQSQTRASRISAQLAAWDRRYRIGRIFAISLAIAAVSSGFGTYALLSRSPFGANADAVLLLLNLDLLLLLLLVVVVARRIVAIWAERRRGSAGSKLHVRLVMLFGLVAAIPAVTVAVFSVLFFNFGLEAWFSERVRTAIQNSEAVAEAYYTEHRQNIVLDALRMARDLDSQAFLMQSNQQMLIQAVKIQLRVREFTEAVVFTGTGDVVARAGLTGLLEFEPLPAQAMALARTGEVAVLKGNTDDRVRALVRLSNFIDHYLLVGRYVDPTVLAHMERTKGAVRQFESLELQRADLQISFLLVFVVVALLLLLAAVWTGMNVATQISTPARLLLTATERVRGGDFTAQVPEGSFREDELGSLARAFNRMTRELSTSREELVEANAQIDARRVFTETVLAGVSSGVIGLDERGRINLSNQSASQLLGVAADQITGEALTELVPEVAGMIEESRRAIRQRPIERQVDIITEAGPRNLLVRVSATVTDGTVRGFVATFDDLSALLSAQRKAAWADVARRIAHEIKNPLTPIQLSAERLKRKYLREIKSDPRTFETCTDTIIRQVADIGRMVDEFSNFARMPAPTFHEENLTEICRQILFLQRHANQHIEYECAFPEAPVMISCDARQVGQALTNLLLNAAEAIEARGNAPDAPRGHVLLRLNDGEDGVRLDIVDNGIGLPREDRHRLTEPYVTTRQKGTGLGLAIVKKIMEDHGGELELGDSETGGARATLSFARRESGSERAGSSGREDRSGPSETASATA